MPEFQEFKIDAKRLLPILERDLYKHPTTMLRELTQNAMDSITRRATLQPSFDPKRDGRTEFRYNPEAKTIIVSDNGCGMSKRLLLDVFRFYGRSDKDGGELGCRGLGAKSIFSWADAFSIQTKSMETGENLSVYVTLEGLSFLDEPPDREDWGTTFTIPSEKPFEKHDLMDFCRCVEIPVYSILNGKEELVSQMPPFDGPVAVIRREDFDIYVAARDGNYGSRSSLYCGGIFVTHYASLDFRDVAVNVKRKELIDLTIGRDDPIENEKWKTFKENVKKAIEETLNQISLTPEFVKSEAGYVLCKWIHSDYHYHGENMILESQRPLFRELMSMTRAVAMRSEYGGTELVTIGGRRRALFLDIVRPDGKEAKTYYSWKPLANVKATVQKMLHSLDQNTRIIYWTKMSRDRFREWAKIFGIEEFDVESLVSRKKALWVKGGLMSSEIEDLKTLEVPLVVFPVGMNQRVLKDASEAFGCAIVKLHQKERVPTTFNKQIIDLRNACIRPMVWFKGQKTVYSPHGVGEKHVKLAPPFLEKYVDVVDDRFVVPINLESAASLVKDGMDLATEDEIEHILLKKVPAKIRKKALENVIGLSNLRVTAKIISELDWKHPYSKAVFFYAIMELAGDYGWQSVRYKFSVCDAVFGEESGPGWGT
jgi:hypothetical protein